MKKEMSNPEGLPIPKFSTDERTNKDSYYFDNNQLIDELDRYLVEIENRKKSIRRRHLIFDLVFSIGMALLIIQLILQW